MVDPSRLLAFVAADWPTAGLACAAKAAGLLAVAALVARCMKGRAAATRHLVWCLGLAGALAVPPLTLAMPRWGVPVLSAPSEASGKATRSIGEQMPESSGASLAAPIQAHPVDLTAPATTVTPRFATSRTIRPGSWLLAAWAAGTAAVLAWLAIGWATVWRIGRRAVRITDRDWLEAAEEAESRLGIARRVTLIRGGLEMMPLTWGVLRPTVLLPQEADAWPADRRRAVLMHELAHVRRRDCLTQWLGLAACAAYWFNPLAWRAASRLRVERELACDDLVLEAGERPSDYASQLLGVARSLRPAPARAHAAMAMARASGLERRLLAILDADQVRRGPARWIAALSLVPILAASATLAAMRPVARPTASLTVSGRVIGADGKPLGGASVVLLASRPATQGPLDGFGDSRLRGRASSDASGEFRVELADGRAEPDDEAVLVATARGAGFATRKLHDLATPLADPLRMPEEQPVALRLVDLQGSPVAGAKVRLRFAYPRVGEGLGNEALNERLLPDLAAPTASDAEGRFTLRGVGPGFSLSLEVNAPGFGKQHLDWETRAGVREGTLALGRAHVIEGRVTLGKGGPPAVGARVRARSMSMKEGVGMNRGDAEATSDADGRYRIEIAPGASVRIQVDPPREGADAYLLRGRLVVPTESVAAREDFALPRGVLVTGHVTEAGTGRPIAGAVVYHKAHRRKNPYYISGTADFFNGDEQKAVAAADGTYRLAVMPGPGYLLARGPTDDYIHREVSTVEVSGELIWPNTRQYPDAFLKLDTKPDDGPLDIGLALRRGVTVGGQVFAPDGEPARDAVLFSRWYLTPSQMTVNFGQRVMAARGGRFDLAGCDPDSSAPVLFLDAARQLGAAIEISGKQSGVDLRVGLQPCGSATVRFLDGEGKPLRAGPAPAHLEVVLTPGASFADVLPAALDEGRASPLMADSIHVSNLDRPRYADLKLDAGGRMTFPTLIPGATYRVVVFNQPVKTQLEFTVKPGEAKDLGDLTIPKVDRAR